MHPTIPFYLILILLFSPACVSKKKYEASLLQIERIKQNQAMETEQWKAQLQTAEDTIFAQQIRLAERRGQNNALVAMQDKLQARIDELELDMDDLSSRSQNSNQNQKKTIQEKEKEIARLKAIIESTSAILDQQKADLELLASDLRFVLQTYETLDADVEVKTTGISLSLPEAFLFRKKSVTRLQEEGVDLLEKISQVLLRYPRMNILVTGHTDNRPPANKSYKDNWNFSVLEAATIVRLLTEEFSINPSQILASGQGEFAPRASNESLDGRLRNRRIGFFISPRPEALPKAIRKSLLQLGG
ncbi:MAG: OmpA family protein [Bacteroidota bacterium]